MGGQTTNLNLVYLAQSQEQPEVLINDAWNKIDAAVGGVNVEDADSPHVSVSNAKTLKFSGATVTAESDDVALVTIDGGGGGGGGSGTVTSIELTSSGGTIAITGTNPITGSGTINLEAVGGGGGGSPDLPGTIPDLQLWWESDDIEGATGKSIYRLRERTPWIGGVAAAQVASTVPVIANSAINGKPALNWAGGGANGYTLSNSFRLAGAGTIFYVVKPNSNAAGQAILGGLSGCAAVYLNTSGANNVNLTQGSIAVIGTSTTAWVAGTAFQGNVSYDITPNLYTIRQGSAAAGSGTLGGAAMNGNISWIGADAAVGTSVLGDNMLAAVIAYNRELTLTEKQSVEAYILAKWGV